MAKIRFHRDIYAGAALLYRKDQIIELDHQMARALILANHAVSADEGTKRDLSSTPGNVTMNTPQGRAAFAAAGTQVVVTNALVTAESTVIVQLGGTDATLLHLRVTPGAGSFTVRGNAAATGITPFDFVVLPL